jgi:hypothetical protein
MTQSQTGESLRLVICLRRLLRKRIQADTAEYEGSTATQQLKVFD